MSEAQVVERSEGEAPARQPAGVERVVRDVPTKEIGGTGERPQREMSRSERVAEAAKVFSAKSAASAAPEKPAEKPAAPVAEAKPVNGDAGKSAVPVTPAPATKEEKPAAAAAPAEKPAEQPAEPAKDKMASRFAAVAERERQVEAKAARVRAELAKQAATIEEGKRQIQAFEALKAKALEDPNGFLKANGLTFEQLARGFLKAQQAAKDGKSADAPAAGPTLTEAEIEAKVASLLEQKLGERQKTAQENAAKQQRAQVREHVANTVRAGDYPGLQMLRDEGAVFDYAEHVFHNGDARRGLAPGTNLPLDKAAALVEASARLEAERLFGVERVRAFIEAGKKPSATPEANGKPQASNGTPAKEDAGEAARSGTGQRPRQKTVRAERDQTGRFAASPPTPRPGTNGAASDGDDEVSFEDERKARLRQIADEFGPRLRPNRSK
jgi:hypothetical protein